MADKKYQVFISSTFKDLKDERLDISRSVLDLGHFPAAMEYFPATDEEQLKYIKRTIDQCDYYVLIIAGKYGSQDASGVSYTELEYDYAVEKGKFVLGFPYRDITILPRNQTETDLEVITRLERFREKVMDGRLVRQWNDRRDLDLQVTKALSTAFNEYPQSGWVRTPKDSSEELLSELNQLRKENAHLSTKLASLTGPALVENIAGLDETFEISMRVEFSVGGGVFTTVTRTWADIFVAAASSIRLRTSRGNLLIALGEKLAPELPGFRVISGKFDEHVLETILVQMTALGLLTTQDRNMYSVTPMGQRMYTNMATIKTKRS